MPSTPAFRLTGIGASRRPLPAFRTARQDGCQRRNVHYHSLVAGFFVTPCLPFGWNVPGVYYSAGAGDSLPEQLPHACYAFLAAAATISIPRRTCLLLLQTVLAKMDVMVQTVRGVHAGAAALSGFTYRRAGAYRARIPARCLPLPPSSTATRTTSCTTAQRGAPRPYPTTLRLCYTILPLLYRLPYAFWFETVRGGLVL